MEESGRRTARHYKAVCETYSPPPESAGDRIAHARVALRTLDPQERWYGSTASSNQGVPEDRLVPATYENGFWTDLVEYLPEPAVQDQPSSARLQAPSGQDVVRELELVWIDGIAPPWVVFCDE